MQMFRLTCILLMITGLSHSSFSQISFQNSYRESVNVAFARYVQNEKDTGWVTKGWSMVTPGTTIKVFNSIGVHDSIGYFVITRISETPYPGSKNLLVHMNEPFLIKDADKELVLQNHPEYEWRKFRLIRLQPGKTSGTITFKD